MGPRGRMIKSRFRRSAIGGAEGPDRVDEGAGNLELREVARTGEHLEGAPARRHVVRIPARGMQIQVNTNASIEGREGLAAHVSAVVEKALSHVTTHVTRVEVHLSDENGAKGGGMDKRCMMEARLEGHQPTAVTHQAATLEQAIRGAADMLQRSIESTLERIRGGHR